VESYPYGSEGRAVENVKTMHRIGKVLGEAEKLHEREVLAGRKRNAGGEKFLCGCWWDSLHGVWGKKKKKWQHLQRGISPKEKRSGTGTQRTTKSSLGGMDNWENIRETRRAHGRTKPLWLRQMPHEKKKCYCGENRIEAEKRGKKISGENFQCREEKAAFPL